MRILVAPAAYKGTINCLDLARSISRGIALQQPDAEIDILPIGDGGDGTIEALVQAIGGELRSVTVDGPVGERIQASWLKLPNSSIVELASASGLKLLAGKLDPINAHTRGTGQVIAACLASQETNITICVGGSASTDGGSGLLMALGAKFLKVDHSMIRLGASELSLIGSCDLSDLHSLTNCTEFQVAVDISNPLLGPNGAAAIYGPQKGATRKIIDRLESGLAHFADMLEAETGRSVRNVPGAGAAGGTAFGVACALDAEIVSGFDWLSSIVGLETRVAAADLIVSAEGCLDRQTLQGKAVGKLASLSKKHGKKLYVLPALADVSYDWTGAGIDRVLPVAKRGQVCSLEDVTAATMELLK
jgi:glycerate kinase